jgi:hypothetical protein
MMADGIERRALIVVDLFVAVSAIAGGFAILAGLLALPIEALQGSIFTSYDVPALVLLVAVGGAALVASIALIRHLLWAPTASFVAGLALMAYLVVEVATIGLSSWLQPFYFVIALIMIVLAVQMMAGERAT